MVVGYGPVGRTLTRILRENELEPTVIELNLATVRALPALGATDKQIDREQAHVRAELRES